MANQYNIQEVEKKIQKFWEREKIYKFDSKKKGKIFSIDTPPTTISGRLHMGHAFGDSQQDFFVRYKRMRGFNILNPFGTDDNGLPTLRLIEKEKKIKSSDMSREEFVKLSLNIIKKEFIPLFLEGTKRLGISADWDIFYSTIDERSRRVSQQSFIDLYKKGREYRINSPALWCTECKTTIAQVELEDNNIPSSFNDIVFKTGGKDLIIATTRPELLPACVAIFYHPNDKRYKSLKGQKAKVPLFDFEVPILEDKKADPTKGTGIVMCCTFGDQTDMEWQKAHELPIKEAITKDGKMTSLAGKYEGMSIKKARDKVIEDLKKEKLLVKQESITHPVNVHERCGTPIEFISTKQWFVRYLDLKPKMLEWGKKVKWYPGYMRHRYNNWVKGLQWDWCISRQIPFGIPFPVWYCKDCEEVILADEKQLPVDPVETKPPIKKCPKCKCSEFIPEKDVMNTWATSAVTPTIVKDIFKGTKVYNKIKNKPMSIRRNGHDIITFWDFNTIVKSQLHYGFSPWDELYINGWILAKDGKKMSKSRGNDISPKDIIEQYGADALRYLSASAKLGDDLAFPEKELVTGKKLLTKLWNASRFVFMNLQDWDGKFLKKGIKLEKIDELFLRKLDELIKTCTENFEKYEYSRVRQDVDRFFWNMFTDNYLEIVKRRIYNEKGGRRKSAQYVLYKSLLTILKLFAPIIPFVTEEIYQTYFKKTEKDKSIHASKWPGVVSSSEKSDEGGKLDLFLRILAKVRQEKTKAKKSMNVEVIITLPREDLRKLGGILQDLKDVTNAQDIKRGKFRVEFL